MPQQPKYTKICEVKFDSLYSKTYLYVTLLYFATTSIYSYANAISPEPYL